MGIAGESDFPLAEFDASREFLIRIVIYALLLPLPLLLLLLLLLPFVLLLVLLLPQSGSPSKFEFLNHQFEGVAGALPTVCGARAPVASRSGAPWTLLTRSPPSCPKGNRVYYMEYIQCSA